MTQLKIYTTPGNPGLGRVFPNSNFSQEELEQREADRQALMKRCELIFAQVQPNLINDYYDWFMAIEPESGDYFIDQDETVAEAKAHEKYPNAECVLFCINETGACYRV